MNVAIVGAGIVGASIAFHLALRDVPLIGELASMEIVDGARIKSLEPYRIERFR